MGKKMIKYMETRKQGLLPAGIVQELINPDKVREYLKGISSKERMRVMAFLTTFKTQQQIADICGVSRRWVEKSVELNKDIIQAATLGRNMAIAGLAEQRAIELLQGLDTSKISDEKKPQSIKYLTDTADIANQHNTPRNEETEETTAELIFRIRSKMKPRVEEADSKPEDGQRVEAEYSEKPLPGNP
ncbi:MAG: hypothetical protein L6437_05235 [Kiritimatiellae bacterium]|nr:hypothetical protein [Kiritimatiellia bacterium]